MRLSEQHKKSIISKAVEKASKKLRQQLNDGLIEFGNSIVDQFYTEEMKCIFATIPEESFEKYFRISDRVKIECDGYYGYAGKFDKRLLDEIPLGRKIWLPPQGVNNMKVAVIGKKHPLYDHSQKLLHLKMDILELESVVRSKVEPIVRSASTRAGLLKLWPECEPFLPPLPAKKELIPAKAIVDVNKLIPLP